MAAERAAAGAGLLLDTDVLVDHLRGARAVDADWEGASYSVITRCELFAGGGVDEDVVRELLAPLRELALERPLAEEGGRLRRLTGIPTPDALIAATALGHELVLVTRNRRHFERVPGLSMRTPE
jgi:predicted nucleic acid-binding protein